MNLRTHTAGKGGLPCAVGVVAVAAALMFAGCASMSAMVPALRPPSRTMPRTARIGHEHVVVASWYGPGFAGRRTSSGERYDPDRLTAASKTLPIGSLVRVTNPDNGRSVDVRINDCGPFVRGRGLDLSKRAAERIGMKHKGVGRVRITEVGRPRYRKSACAL
ncbi:MAG: septal ring lytic transglycosylase RlpA family protein [Candidatus Binataceae bacterium]